MGAKVTLGGWITVHNVWGDRMTFVEPLLTNFSSGGTISDKASRSVARQHNNLYIRCGSRGMENFEGSNGQPALLHIRTTIGRTARSMITMYGK